MTSIILSLAIAWAAAQTPDLSGQWTTQPGAKGDMGSGFGTPITITQSATQLIVEHALFSRYDIQPPVRTVYALDGSESKNEVMIGHSTQVRISRASWDGPSLRIKTTYPAKDPATGKMFTTDVSYQLTLSSPTALVIEATRAGALGGPSTTTSTTYQKN